MTTPILDSLFAVPAWRVVGGWAFDRPYFFDSQTLEPVPEPLLPPPGSRTGP